MTSPPIPEPATAEGDELRTAPEGQPGDDELGGYDALSGLRSVGGSLFTRNHITVHGSFNVGAEAGKRSGFSLVDVTEDVLAQTSTFVAPPRFDALVTALRSERVVLVKGSGCGGLTAAEAALHNVGHKPIVHVPAIEIGQLIDGIETLRGKPEMRNAGLLIESIGTELLGGLAAFELRRLRAALDGGAALVLTERGNGPPLAGLASFAAEPPDAEEVVRSHAGHRGLAADRPLAALAFLEPPVSPAEAVALVDGAADDTLTPQDLAAAVSWNPLVLDAWLREAPSAEAVALLAAAAALDGVSNYHVNVAARDLQARLESGNDEKPVSRRFGRVDLVLPAGVVDTDDGVSRLCRPHTRDSVIDYLWTNLGGGFQPDFLDWLADLGGHPAVEVREGAAITAGILFAADPSVLGAGLLRPWAVDGRPWQRGCAALALGVGAAIDPGPARTLAGRWADATDVRLQHTAVMAYGGVLGAWDPGSEAALHLWFIGEDDEKLRLPADAALARLLIAGPEAVQARASVFGVLLALLELDPVPRRVYELLPRLVSRLSGRDRVAHTSFAALMDEPASLDALATVFARAFDAPSGFASANEALAVLIRAIDEDRVALEAGLDLIRALKRAAKARGRLGKFASQLKRSLGPQMRTRHPNREAAIAVHDAFFT